MAERIGDILIRQFEFDVAVMSQPWMYYCVIPILLYIPFFLIKWWILTAPAWMPIAVILKAAQKCQGSDKEEE